MNIYHIWADLKQGENDMEFAASVTAYLEHLRKEKKLENFRITRKKLGLGTEESLDFHITIEFLTLDQMDKAFEKVATRDEPIESFHFAVNSKVSKIKFALYRDFPDSVRKIGDEKF